MDTFLAGKLDAFSTAREVLKTNKISVIFLVNSMYPKYPSKTEIGRVCEYLHIPFTADELKEVLQKVYPSFKINEMK